MNKGTKIQTILGMIPAGELGICYSHEHLFAHATPELAAKDSDLVLDDVSGVIPDLEAFRKAGGKAIAEMTTVDYGRDVQALKQLSLKTGVHLIAVTGFNKGIYCRPYTEGKEIDEIAKTMISEVVDGIDQTGIKAGLIKFGTSLDRIHPWEEIAARAAARAHLQTGAPIITHTEAGTMGEEQLALLAEEGVSAENVILCHMDRNPDLDLHVKVAERGAFLSYDQIPKKKYDTEDAAIQLVLRLAERNLHKQILIGGDFARKQYFKGWNGEPGLDYLITTFTRKLYAALASAGLAADAIVEDLFVHNPARAFALRRL
ncbi:phosphotriesterase-related protein [Brevibacillus sp. SYP-B805]|uniref:phosphotriesterase family protein n=1 Tax=Brevibacillus sp. SYP-B805 TaxID=1578199 RepID=UPI0013EDB95B|nr:phosphotriesterase-related protein [Brevibacillus sp. SYP-B805]NGQ95759.1 phosphotriesterase-related protein [Brevibacillus sp. SYP-B805]